MFADRNGEWADRYGPLITVISFWYLLLVLKDEGEIVPRLARQVFGYQFRHWRDALGPLHKATAEAAAGPQAPRDLPEWMAILAPGRMDWLTRGGR